MPKTQPLNQATHVTQTQKRPLGGRFSYPLEKKLTHLFGELILTLVVTSEVVIVLKIYHHRIRLHIPLF